MVAAVIKLTAAKAPVSQSRMPNRGVSACGRELSGVAACHEESLTQSSQTGCGPLRGRAPVEQSPPLRTLVFIPAWNEEASIDAVIADVRAHLPEADILVVDDGSTDATTERARAAGVLVATLPFNQGLGAALQTGYLWALREGYDFCAHLDADGQHPAAEVARAAGRGAGGPRRPGDRLPLREADRAAARGRAARARTTRRPGRGGSASTSSASSSPWRPASASPTRPAACAPPTAG